MIGLSLSLCIKDVIDGVMPVEAIDRLITGTCAPTEEIWAELLEQYSQYYWDRPLAHWIDGPTEQAAKAGHFTQ